MSARRQRLQLQLRRRGGAPRCPRIRRSHPLPRSPRAPRPVLRGSSTWCSARVRGESGSQAGLWASWEVGGWEADVDDNGNGEPLRCCQRIGAGNGGRRNVGERLWGRLDGIACIILPESPLWTNARTLMWAAGISPSSVRSALSSSRSLHPRLDVHRALQHLHECLSIEPQIMYVPIFSNQHGSGVSIS
ncbi:hypothetical protein C8Q80DRAFT_11666 [Daedaleopsis nitida]|nr:hypothetical protein C8Q80DRAFT_11666 [Daedaleopsis nitida]